MNTVKPSIIAGVILLGSLATYAQPEGGPSNRRKQIEVQKIAFISTDLELTPEEAQVFWPVYNSAHREQKELRKSYKPNDNSKEGKPKKTLNTMSDKELNDRLNKMLEYEQAELNLKKKHVAQYKEVLPVRKVAMLFEAEKKFKRRLMSDIRVSGEQRGQAPQRKKTKTDPR